MINIFKGKITDKYEPYTKEGKEFKELWLKCKKYGDKKKLCKQLNISPTTFDMIRKKLKLPKLYSPIHDGRKKMFRTIRKLYLKEDKSTSIIANYFRIRPESIRQILIKFNYERKPQHITNPLYVRNKNNKNIRQVLRDIETLYNSKKTIKEIAKTLNIDQASVSRKLKLLGYPVRNRLTKLKEPIYCRWCRKEIFEVNVTQGIRKQLYCSNRCRSKSKDLRAYLQNKKTQVNALSMMQTFLKKTWKDQYNAQLDLILNPNPVVQKLNKIKESDIINIHNIKI